MVELIVPNEPGVLNRITGLYAKRFYNIDGLTVNEAADPSYSLISIVSSGDVYMRSQVMKQLEKLYDVKQAVLFEFPKMSVDGRKLIVK